MRLIGLLLVTICPAFSGEYAVLASGARLHIDRHEVEGANVRLFNGEGYTELSLSLIAGYEPDGRVAAIPVSTPVPNLPAAPAPGPTPEQLADAAADKYGLPRALVRSVMAAESGFAPSAVSPKGAIGLMQLMPETAQTLKADPRDPAQNADAGARYLRDLLVRYDGSLWHALAAYNAGPGAVDKYNGIPPYRETLDYIRRVDAKYKAETGQAAN